jgi:hypothetical protein
MNMKLVEEETEKFIGLLSSIHQNNDLGNISTILLLQTNESMTVYHDILFLKHRVWVKTDMYSLPNIVRVVKSRRMRWAGHVAHMGEGRVMHRVLVGKPEGRRPLGRPRRRWEDNIKRGLQEVGGSCGDWMEWAQDRDRWRTFVSTVMNFRIP